MNRKLKIALTVLGSLYRVLPSVAFAGDQPAIGNVMGDPAEQQHVISAAAQSTVVLQNPCPTAQYSIEKKFTPYKPVKVDSMGKISSGAWKQIVNEQGCGVTRVLNVLVSVQDSSTVSIVPLLPGTTHADPTLQKDAVKYAVQSLSTVPGGREANCRIGYVANTEFVEQGSSTLPGAKGPDWRELWTLASCTQRMLVPMRFIPDTTGTTISAGPNTAIKVVPQAVGSTE